MFYTHKEFHRNSGKGSDLVDSWLGYCAFHAGDYKRAMHEYDSIVARVKSVKDPKIAKDANINLACAFFFLGTGQAFTLIHIRWMRSR